MLPPPASPASKPRSRWTLRVPRDAALVMLRNNVVSLGGLLLFNWFFPIYPRLKVIFLPKSWQETFSTIELGVLSLVFGVNILIALVSIRYPRAPYPPLRTPSKPVVNVTPVRRPVKGLGTSSSSRFFSGGRSLGSSGYASTPMSTPSRMTNYKVPSSLDRSNASSTLSTSTSYNSSPLAAYMGRHGTRSGRPIDSQLFDSLTADGDTPY